MNLTVAIIAGGKSNRFGSPKAKALFNEKPLIDYAIKLAKSISEQVIIVNGKNLSYQESGIKTIADIIPDCGPIGGIFTALLHSNNSFVCTLPCDMPLLVPDLFRLLYERRSVDRPVVAISESGIEPLLSLWPTCLVSLLFSFIKGGKYSLRNVLIELQATAVNVPLLVDNYEPSIFTNVNYKNDLKKINRIHKINSNEVFIE